MIAIFRVKLSGSMYGRPTRFYEGEAALKAALRGFQQSRTCVESIDLIAGNPIDVTGVYSAWSES